MWTGLLGEFDGEDLALDAGLVGGGLSAGGRVDGDHWPADQAASAGSDRIDRAIDIDGRS